MEYRFATDFKRQTVKSRSGCFSCKTRHIKCDEQRPRCANCFARDTECRYPPPKRTARNATAAKVAEFQTTFAVAEPDRVADMWLKTRVRRLNGTSPSAITVSPLAFSSAGSSNKSLELELMHRWSTRAWKLIYTVPESATIITTYYTRDSLSFTCMTKQMLAAGALETALYGGGSRADAQYYVNACLRYVREANDHKKKHVKTITKDNIWLLAEYNGIAAMMQFVLATTFARGGSNYSSSNSSRSSRSSSAESCSIIDLAIGFWKGMGPCYDVCATNWEWLFHSHGPVRTIREKYPPDLSLLDTMPRVRDATRTMVHLQRLVRLPLTGDPALDGDDGGGPYASAVPSYVAALSQTRYAFAEDRLQGYFMSVATVVHATGGSEFLDGVAAREPVALFTFMFWGVLCNTASYDDMIWWVRSTGRELVRETSEVLLTSSIIYLDDVQKGISWCRQQVDLEPVEFPKLSPFEDMIAATSVSAAGITTPAVFEELALAGSGATSFAELLEGAGDFDDSLIDPSLQ